MQDQVNREHIPQRELKPSSPLGRSASFLQGATPFLSCLRTVNLPIWNLIWLQISLSILWGEKSFFSPQGTPRMVPIVTQFGLFLSENLFVYGVEPSEITCI